MTPGKSLFNYYQPFMLIILIITSLGFLNMYLLVQRCADKMKMVKFQIESC